MANVETAFAIAMIRDAAVCLTRAEGDDIFHSTQSHWFATGVVGLKRGVEALGFRLVPIETPAEAHDKAIAARVAEEPSAADQPSLTEAIEAGEDKNADIEGGR